MEDVKKKVLLDLFASPSTLLPVAAGLSAFVLSWAVDGNTWLNLAGLAGVLGGAGMFATRLIFGLESLTERAYDYLSQQREREREEQLDRLDDKLKGDRDPRTEDCLRHLRHLYNSFRTDVAKGRISGATRPVVDQVDKLFRACVSQLEQSYELWMTAHGMSGSARRNLLGDREEIIHDVLETVEHLERTLTQLRTFHRQRSDLELDKLRSELDETLRVARKAEERIAALDSPGSQALRETE